MNDAFKNVTNERDIWRPLADFLTNMIAKYANEMDFDKLPDPDNYLVLRAMSEAYRRYEARQRKRRKAYIEIEFFQSD